MRDISASPASAMTGGMRSPMRVCGGSCHNTQPGRPRQRKRAATRFLLDRPAGRGDDGPWRRRTPAMKRLRVRVGTLMLLVVKIALACTAFRAVAQWLADTANC